MKKNSIYTDVGENVFDDTLSEFIYSLNIDAKKFGHSRNDPYGGCGERIIGEFEIICMLRGECTFCVGCDTYKSVAGDVIFIPPYVRHSMQSDVRNPCDNFWIHFDVYPFYKARQLEQIFTSNGSYKTVIQTDSKIFEIFSNLENYLADENPGSKLYFQTSTLQILMLILQASRLDLSSVYASPAQSKLISDTTSYIYAHITAPCTVPELCKELHVSQSTLFKAFSKELRMTPNELVTVCKLKKAEQLLKTTGSSIAEIAALCGFSSPYYFSSVFKKIYGKSPRDYLHDEGF